MSKLAFLVMPLWQGSPSARAMQIIDGAEILREDLPESARYDVVIPLEAGDTLGTPIARLSSVVQARDRAREVLTELPENSVGVTLGGDCATALAGLEAAVQTHGADHLAVLWFDAHADLQHPSTSPSGAAAGMALRHALGDGSDDLRFETPITDTMLTLVGARALDDEEHHEATRRDISRVDLDNHSPEAFAQEVRRVLTQQGATHVYVHIDLDVLDPAEFSSVSSPVPFGLSLSHLTESIRAALTTLPLAGATICGFQPPDSAGAHEDLPSILRVLGSLTNGAQK